MRCASLSITLWPLVLLSTSCALFQPSKPEGSPTTSPAPRSTCHELNLEEWAGWNAIVQVAVAQEAKGDEYHFAKATIAIGAILKECFPESFKPRPEPAVVPTPAPATAPVATPPPTAANPAPAPTGKP